MKDKNRMRIFVKEQDILRTMLVVGELFESIGATTFSCEQKGKIITETSEEWLDFQRAYINSGVVQSDRLRSMFSTVPTDKSGKKE